MVCQLLCGFGRNSLQKVDVLVGVEFGRRLCRGAFWALGEVDRPRGQLLEHSELNGDTVQERAFRPTHRRRKRVSHPLGFHWVTQAIGVRADVR